MKIKMKEIRCANPECKKLLGYEALKTGSIYIDCRHCKKTTLVTTLPETIPQPDKFKPVRCGECAHFLYEEAIVSGIVRVKCRGCHRFHTLDIDAKYGLLSKLDMVEQPSGPL